MKVILTKGLTKSFAVGFFRKKVQAVTDLDLEVEEGEIFGFLGPNGAGKTTTIKMLLGLIRPTRGEAFIFGKEAGDVKLRARIGFLPEQPYFYDYLTGDEFLYFYSKFFDLPEKEKEKRIEYLIELVGLKDARSLSLRKYSKGMLQRIGLAQALLNNPELVILDEPLGGLDPIGRKELRDVIAHLRDEKKTVFFSSHILSDVEMICDRIGVIDRGRLLKIGKLDEIVQPQTKEIEIHLEIKSPENRRIIEAMAGDEMKITSIGEQVLIKLLDEKKANEIVKKSLDMGGRVLNYSRHRESLEEAFWKMVGKELGS